MSTALKSLVELRLAETGQSAIQAAERVGLNRLFLRDILTGKKESFSARFLDSVALALEVDPDVLAQAMGRKPKGNVPLHAPALSGEARLAPVPYLAPTTLAQDVPIYGTAAGSVLGVFEGFNFEDGAIGHARRPPGLNSHRDAYALYVVGDSMYPEHKAGDLRFATPHRPPAIGDTVIIQVRQSEGAPLQAFIKTLVRRTPTAIIVSQHNPPATMEFGADTIIAIHRVPPLNDLYGI
jgi:phage repressor protein C with HTH and peptisase S24 domain